MCLLAGQHESADTCFANDQWGYIQRTAYIPGGLGDNKPLTVLEVEQSLSTAPFHLTESAILSETVINSDSSVTWREINITQGIKSYSLLTRGRRVIVRDVHCPDITYIIEHVCRLNESDANISVFAYFRNPSNTQKPLGAGDCGLQCFDAYWTPFVLAIRGNAGHSNI